MQTGQLSSQTTLQCSWSNVKRLYNTWWYLSPVAALPSYPVLPIVAWLVFVSRSWQLPCTPAFVRYWPMLSWRLRTWASPGVCWTTMPRLRIHSACHTASSVDQVCEFSIPFAEFLLIQVTNLVHMKTMYLWFPVHQASALSMSPVWCIRCDKWYYTSTHAI